jgi:hypothetical protein
LSWLYAELGQGTTNSRDPMKSQCFSFPTFALRIPGKGFVAQQGSTQWFQDEPCGWALFTVRSTVESLAETFPEAVIHDFPADKTITTPST